LDNFGYSHCSETLAMYLDEHKMGKNKMVHNFIYTFDLVDKII